MRWNVAIAATGRCKRVCTGSAARSVERVALPWTCFANREPKAEIKLLGRYTRHVGDTHDTESLLQCPNFMGFHPIPRFRAYLGASMPWLGAAWGQRLALVPTACPLSLRPARSLRPRDTHS